jgi:hypothetical protein
MTRLLALTGAGGSGKTRLALEVTRDLVGAYPDGVWLVELAPISEGELVAKTVAEALGVSERPQEPLSDVLRDRKMLLVLDNCEHLVDAAAQLVDTLLSACPRLSLLATSREALGVEGEFRWTVPPLSVPHGTPSSTRLGVLGLVLLGVALWRAEFAPPWVPIVLLLGLAIGLIIGVSAWFGSLLVGLGYLGVKVLRMTDDEWARGVGQVTEEAIHATS